MERKTVSVDEYINLQAPMGVLVTTKSEHAKLIKRGFKTHYTCDLRINSRGEYALSEGVASFGHTDLVRENGDFDGNGRFPVNFHITGLPPPQGTTVWLRFASPGYGEGLPALAYMNKRDAIYGEIPPRTPDPFFGFIEETTEEKANQLLYEIEQEDVIEFEGRQYGVLPIQLP